MQINNNNSITFNGHYIIKGDIKSIEKFSKLVHANYIDDSYGFVNLKNPDKFWGWEEEVLIPKFCLTKIMLRVCTLQTMMQIL